MEPTARLFLCARCRVQVVLCRRCDRGNRYCGQVCRGQARAEARRLAAQRYQRSRRGRLAHAERSRHWRQRQALARGDDAQKVTHQGCLPAALSAPLASWTHDKLSVALAEQATDAALDPTIEASTHSALAQPAIATPAWSCWRCGARQPAAVRLGFVRHALALRWRHDHSP